MTAALLKLVELGTLPTVDESLYNATEMALRFRESVIQFINRKPNPLGHLVYMGVCPLEFFPVFAI